MVEDFIYLGLIIFNSLLFEFEFNKCIGKVVVVMVRLLKRVWENNKFIIFIKIVVYRVCILSILFYGSESWIIYLY